MNLGFVCCQTLLLSSFCRATGICCFDGCCTAVWLSFKALENASTWAILLPFLCSMVKSYCWSLHNHRTLLLDGRSTVLIVSSVIWSVIILNGFTLRNCLNFSTPYTTAKHSCSVIRYFFSCSLYVLLAQAIILSLLSSPFWCKTAPTPPPDASVYRINGLSKSGWATTGAVASLAFMASKAFCLADIHSNDTDLPFSFLVSSYMGLVISENPLTYCQ